MRSLAFAAIQRNQTTDSPDEDGAGAHRSARAGELLQPAVAARRRTRSLLTALEPARTVGLRNISDKEVPQVAGAERRRAGSERQCGAVRGRLG